MLLKVLHSICQQFGKLSSDHRNGKDQFSCQSQRMFKLPYDCIMSHARKIMLKILQARFQWYVNCALPDVQTGFRKNRGTRDQIVNIQWIIEKAGEFLKNIYLCFIDYAKAFDCVDHTKLRNFLKQIGIPDHLT